MLEPLNRTDLTAYLARIGYAGTPTADLPTLKAIHSAHVQMIPFENLDIQLGQVPSLDLELIFAKLVTRRRGGWCYEMNGLLGAALAAIGFEVTRMSGWVLRDERTDSGFGTHLCLRVMLDQPYLADAGFGAALLYPIALAESAARQDPLPVALRRTPDQHWQFAVQIGGRTMTYDFADVPGDEAEFAAKCDWQGRDPASVFVQNLVVQHRRHGAHEMLRGKVLTRTTAAGVIARELASAGELTATLLGTFGLDMPVAAALWPAVEARHAALLA